MKFSHALHLITVEGGLMTYKGMDGGIFFRAGYELTAQQAHDELGIKKALVFEGEFYRITPDGQCRVHEFVQSDYFRDWTVVGVESLEAEDSQRKQNTCYVDVDASLEENMIEICQKFGVEFSEVSRNSVEGTVRFMCTSSLVPSVTGIKGFPTCVVIYDHDKNRLEFRTNI